MIRKIRNIIIFIFLISMTIFISLFFWTFNNRDKKEKKIEKIKIDSSLLKNQTQQKINQIKKMNENENKLLNKINLIYSEWENLIKKTRILTIEEEQKLLLLEKEYQKTSDQQRKHRKWIQEYFLFIAFCEEK